MAMSLLYSEILTGKRFYIHSDNGGKMVGVCLWVNSVIIIFDKHISFGSYAQNLSPTTELNYTLTSKSEIDSRHIGLLIIARCTSMRWVNLKEAKQEKVRQQMAL